MLLLAAPLCSCLGPPDPIELRFRVTMELIDHGVRRHGQAIWSYTRITPRFPLVDQLETRFVAEAIAIPAAGQGWLFVLPNNVHFSGGGAEWMLSAYDARPTNPWDARQALRSLAADQGRTARITCVTRARNQAGPVEGAICPTILYASDPADKASFREIAAPDGQAIASVRVDSITFAITRDVPSARLSSLVPWLPRRPHRGTVTQESPSDFLVTPDWLATSARPGASHLPKV